MTRQLNPSDLAAPASFLGNQNNELLSYYAAPLERHLPAGSALDIAGALLDAKAKLLVAEIARDRSELANRAKTDFLMNISHEIRTPMSAIIGLANILLMTQLDGKQTQYVSALHDSANALMNIVSGLLDIGKIESGTVAVEHTPFSMALLLDQIAGIMSVKAEEKGIVVALQCGAEPHDIFVGDSGHIRQILLNLVGNAIKFTEAGHVSIALASGKLENGKKKLSISVTDSGIGICEENLGAIFGRFIQADATISGTYGGTGLGLSISKMLAENMGGAITVSSTVGLGSRFTLHLHLAVKGERSEYTPIYGTINHQMDTGCGRRARTDLSVSPGAIRHARA